MKYDIYQRNTFARFNYNNLNKRKRYIINVFYT